jgi:hypothetical protein
VLNLIKLKTMITNCLLDYVGITGCSPTAPPSDRYLNEMAGIELRKMDEIASEEQQNYIGVWNDIQKRALKRFQMDVRVAFLKKYKLKGVAQSINIGQIIDADETSPSAAKYRGFKIELNDANDEVVYSVLQAINVQTLKLYVKSGTPTFNVKVFDLDTGVEIYTKEVVVTSVGWQNIEVNTHFMSRRIFVCYDSTLIEAVDLDIKDHQIDNCFNCQAKVRGGSSDISTPTTVNEDVWNTFGLSGVFSVDCVWDTLVCNNKDSFVLPLMYLLAIEFVTEWLNTPRINEWSLISEDKAKWLLSYYSALYKGGVFEDVEYDSALMDSIDQFNVDEMDCCVECSGDIRFMNSYI